MYTRQDWLSKGEADIVTVSRVTYEVGSVLYQPQFLMKLPRDSPKSAPLFIRVAASDQTVSLAFDFVCLDC